MSQRGRTALAGAGMLGLVLLTAAPAWAGSPPAGATGLPVSLPSLPVSLPSLPVSLPTLPVVGGLLGSPSPSPTPAPTASPSATPSAAPSPAARATTRSHAHARHARPARPGHTAATGTGVPPLFVPTGAVNGGFPAVQPDGPGPVLSLGAGYDGTAAASTRRPSVAATALPGPLPGPLPTGEAPASAEPAQARASVGEVSSGVPLDLSLVAAGMIVAVGVGHAQRERQRRRV